MSSRRRNSKRRLPSHYSLSVIVPAYNELENLEPLAREFDDFLSQQRFRAEVIIGDDGSSDGTGEKALELSREYRFLKVVRHPQNEGKTAAIETGFIASKGKRIAIFDADLQYDARDIKRMMDKLDRGYGIVAGIKKGKYQKPWVSRVYNSLTGKLFGLKVKDMNSMKILRRDVMADLFMRKDWHRFMVVLAAERGHKVAEIPVRLRPRKYGEAKYSGPGRVFVGMTDLTAVWLSERVFKKPMLYFGSFGFAAMGLAILLALVILVARLGFDWGYPPLQTLLILLISLAGFSLTLGFLAEAIANLRDRVEFLLRTQTSAGRPKVEQRTSSRKKSKKDEEKTSEKKSSRKTSARERKKSSRKSSDGKTRKKTSKSPGKKSGKRKRKKPDKSGKSDQKDKREVKSRRKKRDKSRESAKKSSSRKKDEDRGKKKSTERKKEDAPRREQKPRDKKKAEKAPTGPKESVKKSKPRDKGEKGNGKTAAEKPRKESGPDGKSKKPQEAPPDIPEVSKKSELEFITPTEGWGRGKRKSKTAVKKPSSGKEGFDKAAEIAKRLDVGEKDSSKEEENGE